MKHQIDKVKKTDWKDLKKSNEDRIPSLTAYDRELPNVASNHKQILECSSNKSEVARNISEQIVRGI